MEVISGMQWQHLHLNYQLKVAWDHVPARFLGNQMTPALNRYISCKGGQLFLKVLSFQKGNYKVRHRTTEMP